MNAKQGQRWGIILAFLGFAIGIPGFWLLIAHDHFEATARIEINRAHPDTPRYENPNIHEPNFTELEFQFIKSEQFLSNVVNTLHLDAEWGNRYAEGRKLELAETVGLLKQALHLRPVRNTMLIDISVISEDAPESAKIANAIAETYRDYPVEDRLQLKPSTLDIKGLQEQLAAQQKKSKTAQEEVDRLKKELNVPDGVADEKLDSKFLPYLEAKRVFEKADQAGKVLNIQILSANNDMKLPQESGVRIIARAEPPTNPIAPNRQLGKVLLGVGVLLLVCGFVTFVRNWRRPDEATS